MDPLLKKLPRTDMPATSPEGVLPSLQVALCKPHELHHIVLDKDHREFSDRVERLRKCDGLEFTQCFSQLVLHTEAHFARENHLMDQSGCPALKVHRDEHNRVLADMRRMEQRALSGKLRYCRAYALEQLPAWFNLHSSSMDLVVARWLEVHS